MITFHWLEDSRDAIPSVEVSFFPVLEIVVIALISLRRKFRNIHCCSLHSRSYDWNGGIYCQVSRGPPLPVLLRPVPKQFVRPHLQFLGVRSPIANQETGTFVLDVLFEEHWTSYSGSISCWQ